MAILFEANYFCINNWVRNVEYFKESILFWVSKKKKKQLDNRYFRNFRRIQTKYFPPKASVGRYKWLKDSFQYTEVDKLSRNSIHRKLAFVHPSQCFGVALLQIIRGMPKKASVRLILLEDKGVKKSQRERERKGGRWRGKSGDWLVVFFLVPI